MYDFLYKLFFALKRKHKKRIENGQKPAYFTQRVIDYIERYYNLYFKKQLVNNPSSEYGLNTTSREEKIIVSLTSFPKRIDTVWLTIETLLRQTVKPDAVILWLADSQFDGLDSLPQELLNLQSRGLTIRFCDDLRSHKKYYYAIQEYPEDIVILVDDDMFYPRDTICKLMDMHREHPDDICTMTAQYIDMLSYDGPSGWRNPRLDEKMVHSEQLQVFTGSGSLYPPHSFGENAFDKELIMKLCPYADDLWLTYMAHKKGTRITMAYPWHAFPITIYGTSENSLWHINAADGKNDQQWQAILNYFEETIDDSKNI